MINDDKTFYHKALVWSVFLFLVIELFVTVYHRYAIFLRPISPSIKIIGVASLNKLLLHNSCKLNYYHPICSIIVVNRTVIGNVQSILQSKTNRCHSDFSFIKKAYDPKRTILFGESTVQTFVTLDTSTRYTNKSETILQTKPFIAFLNRNSGIKRGQPHNTYNIIITGTKQRQLLCFFCVVVQPFRAQVPTLTMKRPQSHRYTFMLNQ